jgi:hypothetical protein
MGSAELLGYTVVSLPFWEWDLLTGSDARKEYKGQTAHFMILNDSSRDCGN